MSVNSTGSDNARSVTVELKSGERPPHWGEVATMDRVGIERLDGWMLGHSALALLCSSPFGNGDLVALGA